MNEDDNAKNAVVVPSKIFSPPPPPPPPLTPKSLLNLCNLTTTTTKTKGGSSEDVEGEEIQQRKKERLEILEIWQRNEPKRLTSLLFDKASVDPKTGCYPFHWAAGTAFNEAVTFLLNHVKKDSSSNNNNNNNNNKEEDENNGRQELLVNQLAVKPSTGRTPLHYAARNGHLSTCRLLVEKYGANPNPKCHRGSVTPLQLAVWQNRIDIVQYLVDHINDTNNIPKEEGGSGSSVVLEVNDFACGLHHWIGLIPKHRWLSDPDDDDNGSGVLPLARYLHEQGVSYTSIPANQQNQGHTPLHKAAWGGNVALMEYYRDYHDVYDTVQDAAGNYAADLAQMGGQTHARQWLHQQGSLARHQSCNVLGLPVTATKEEIQSRYKTLARQYHPDKLSSVAAESSEEDADALFVKIKAAYEHLIHQDGAGNQRNPKHEALRLLTMAKKETADEKDDNAKEEDDDDLFHARILAIISDYGTKGFPISGIARRWNQIWPDRPFPSPENYIIQVAVTGPDGTTTSWISKKVRLLKFLKWKCQSVVMFRKIDGVELAFQRTSTSTTSSTKPQTRQAVVVQASSSLEPATQSTTPPTTTVENDGD